MRKISLILILLCPIISAQTKSLILKKIDTQIVLDGIIDEVWNQADSISDFSQYLPYNQKTPDKKTTAKIFSTENEIYCLIIAYDERKNIETNTGKLDDFSGDVVSVMFDTFNDRKTAYKFAVSASGVRADCRLLDDARNRDYSWDGIWFSASEVYDWGYVIEMKIPYKSIQYDEKLTDWGLDFDRWIPILSEDIYWIPYDENEGQRISKFGKLIFDGFKPTSKGLNLEVYPVAFAKADYIGEGKYKVKPEAGIDIFYNPSPVLTFSMTANPDFAQIEADPFNFNISRYESYFSERRAFFTEGSEIFNPAGKQRNSGFYSPLQLFYSRRIGKVLPDGNTVPIIVGSKAFGRLGDWEYGGFVAFTGKESYNSGGVNLTEQNAVFASGRIKKHILDNSEIGILFVGKNDKNRTDAVIDIDGAFRGNDWQLAYQAARSFKDNNGDFAFSAGFTKETDSWLYLFKGKHIGEDFDIDEIGYVPWRGTTDFVGLTGPVWRFEKGFVRQLTLYTGPALDYTIADSFLDQAWIFGINMQFRNYWGYEISVTAGKAKTLDIRHNSQEFNLSSWFNSGSVWNGNIYGGYSKDYNFYRNYFAFFSWGGISFNWNIIDELKIGTSFNSYIEGNPDNNIEEITYNARPYFSLTPINNLNLRVYVDNVMLRSTGNLERVIFGFLFSYNFSPKSWIYFALNEVQSRDYVYDLLDNPVSSKLNIKNRAGVFKIRYLYYF